MLKSEKRSPVLADLDPMPFGKYKGTPMQDVPATYLLWLKNEGCNNPYVANYIHNNWEAIESELPENLK